MGAGHSHASPSHANERQLGGALALTTTFLVVEIVGGILSGSLATISSGQPSLTAHVVYDPVIVDTQLLLDNLRAQLESEFDIHHVTLQLEREDCGQGHARPTGSVVHAHGHAH